eukprot:Anaeramoba_ignava/a90315_71.p1 GENE.a90315_71~~a90315_71.p1  ORF type:complete len:463 (+),score=147.51 a90315_71:22-1389(+)
MSETEKKEEKITTDSEKEQPKETTKKGKGKGKGKGKNNPKKKPNQNTKKKPNQNNQKAAKKKPEKQKILPVIEANTFANVKIKTGEGAKQEQTSPPTIPVDELFEDKNFPIGIEMEYPNDNTSRITNEELRMKERMMLSDILPYLRKAAEVHRQTRQFANAFIRPGIKLWDMCVEIEEMNRKLISAQGLEAGLAFPTGCSINNCAAHYTPNKGDDRTLGKSDVMKIDFGLHINGYIIDSAYTVCFDPKFDPLLKASREATNAAVKAAGIDVRLCDLGEIIQEVIESHEVEIDGKVHNIVPIQNLSGHSLGPYEIHSGKSVPLVKGTEQKTRMEEGELFAFETFASTGKGVVSDENPTSHYMMRPDTSISLVTNPKARPLYHVIEKNFGTLAFCPRWLDRLDQTRYLFNLKHLVDSNVVRPYPPLSDINGSFVSQFEHTLILKPSCKEVLSKGDDY